MDYVGYGCSGFAFTDTYIRNTLQVFDAFGRMQFDGVVRYNDFQNQISSFVIDAHEKCQCADDLYFKLFDKDTDGEGTVEKLLGKYSSRIRMLFPVFLDIEVLDKNAFIFSSSKVDSIDCSKPLLTERGRGFLAFLKVYYRRDLFSNPSVIELLHRVFFRFHILFLNSLYEINPAYRDLIDYFKTHNTITKAQFYAMATCRYKNEWEKLEVYLENCPEEVTPVKNVNDFGYVTGFLKNGFILDSFDNKFFLARDYYSELGEVL